MSSSNETAQYAAARVISFKEAAALAGLSVSTFKQLITNRDGPRLTRLSERRRGVRLSDFTRWLDERAA